MAAVAILVVGVCLGAAYVLRQPLRQEATTLAREVMQPSLEANNRAGLNQFLDQHVTDILAQSLETTAISGPLRRSAVNPRYFFDANGKPVYLTGSHTWNNFQDSGQGSPPPAFDYNQYLDFMAANNYNFIRLWVWEQSRWTVETRDNDYWFNPESAFRRTGPGLALDGKPKFDLNQFDQAYFDRLRQRVIQAGQRNMYVSIMLFNGFSVSKYKSPSYQNPWHGHPYNPANNINGVDGDLNNDDSGDEVHTLQSPEVLAYEKAYVRKVIDTVNDLDNVLFEISNESFVSATAWQHEMIDYIKQYEATKPKQHPVGMSAQTYPEGTDADLLSSNADWISPSGLDYKSDPPDNTTSKVIIPDTDHLWGIGGDSVYVWKSFTRGLNPVFMDCYDGAGYGVGGIGCNFNDPVWVRLRAAMNYTAQYAKRMNLAAAIPRSDLCSTRYCLANAAANNAEYLVYKPAGFGSFTVNLSSSGESYNVEWLNPDNGTKSSGGTVQGGATRTFNSPFGSGGDAALYLFPSTGASTPTATTQPPPPPPPNTPTPTGTAMFVPTATPTATPTKPPTATPQPNSTATPVPSPTPTVQAFPSTPLLDNFNRPNGRLGVRWIDAAGIYKVKNQRMMAGATGQAIWQPQTFGANQEAWVTIATRDGAEELGVLLKAQLGANNVLLGAVRVGYSPALGEVRLATYTQAAGWQTIGSGIKAIFNNGDRIGARARADGAIEILRNTTLIGRGSVAGWQYAGAGGRIGVWLARPGTASLDSFGGGNVTLGPVATYQLEVVSSVQGQGTVQITPDGAITCGQPVTIQAIPSPGWVFMGWDGDVFDSANPLAFNLEGSLSLVARFAPQTTPANLAVTSTTDGSGQVVASPPGPYRQGQTVTLRAVPDNGWMFDGWTGLPADAENPYRFNIGGNTTVGAKFVAVTPLYLPAVSFRSIDVQSAAGSCQ